MTSSFPANSERHSHELQVDRPLKNRGKVSRLALPQGQTTGIRWAAPSAKRSLTGYRLEGLTHADGWRTITEFSPNQENKSKSLLEIEGYTHVRLRASFKWTTSRPSIAVPVGAIEFDQVKETP